MRLREVIERAVLYFLMLRMIAAPVALRPLSPTPRPSFHIVARVCAWPVQGPQRFQSRLSLVPLPRGKGPVATGLEDLRPQFSSVPQIMVSWLIKVMESSPSPGQLFGCLRC